MIFYILLGFNKYPSVIRCTRFIITLKNKVEHLCSARSIIINSLQSRKIQFAGIR